MRQVQAARKEIEEEEDKVLLIANAVISRMIKKEKILRIIEDSRDHATRMLAVHPDILDETL